MITLPTAVALTAAVLTTSFLSGIFGMAGGIILMGILLAMMPLAPAMVLHGATQLTSNAWRAWLWRSEIRWGIFACYTAGALAAAIAFMAVSYAPSKPVTLIAIGAISFIGLWLPGRFAPDITRFWHAVGIGGVCTALHLVAGISGPILDVSFVRTDLNRRETVATKAVVQALGHLLKVIYFGQLLATSGEAVAPAALALALVLAVIGTQLSRSVLDAITDTQFRRWSRGLIVGIAAACMIQGLYLLGTPASAEVATQPVLRAQPF
jgi:uncharacterized membrane protein YfcA